MFFDCLLNLQFASEAMLHVALATYTFQWLYRYCIHNYCYCVLGTSLLLWIYAPIYSYYCSYKHYLLPMCFKCLYILPLYILCIYSFMYWKSVNSDLLVLMLFVSQCTDYKYFFLLFLLLQLPGLQSWRPAFKSSSSGLIRVRGSVHRVTFWCLLHTKWCFIAC